TVESMDQAEDHLIFSAVTDDGGIVDPEAASRLFALPGAVRGHVADEVPAQLRHLAEQSRADIERQISERNTRFYEAESEKLDGWADDLKLGLEREIKDLDRQIKDSRRLTTAALTLEEKLAGQKRIKALESQRNEKRRSLFDAQDKVDKQREELISNLEGKLSQHVTLDNLFTIRWKLD